MPRKVELRMKKFLLLNLLWSFAACVNLPLSANEDASLKDIKLPPGFSISYFAENVPNARSMTLSPNGTVFVGSRKAGKVYALLDKDKDGKAEQVFTLVQGLNEPNGVAFKDGTLYVAEIHRILRFADIENRLSNPPQPQVVTEAYPDKWHHGWKFIAFGPDGKLYVPVGAPCNVCVEDNPIFASITRLDVLQANPKPEIIAKGIRNTVGFTWQPDTQELWFTDNGRDMISDDIPPDELNHLRKVGENFGFPYCHGKNILDPQFGLKKACADYTLPAQELGPHVAALGLRFYTGTQFPEKYRKQLFIAEHGSWNRSTKIGYRVSLVTLEGNRAVNYEPFAEGWLKNGDVSGRPVDVLVMPDGALLISDDFKGAIYRVTYK